MTIACSNFIIRSTSLSFLLASFSFLVRTIWMANPLFAKAVILIQISIAGCTAQAIFTRTWLMASPVCAPWTRRKWQRTMTDRRTTTYGYPSCWLCAWGWSRCQEWSGRMCLREESWPAWWRDKLERRLLQGFTSWEDVQTFTLFALWFASLWTLLQFFFVFISWTAFWMESSGVMVLMLTIFTAQNLLKRSWSRTLI